MGKIISVLAMTLFFLAGCATHNPVPKGYTGALSTIKDTGKYTSSIRAVIFELGKVDGRGVRSSYEATDAASRGLGAVVRLVKESRKVPAKKSVLHLRASAYMAMPLLAVLSDLYSVSGDVTVVLKPNRTYYVRGTVSKEYSAVWLEDDRGRVASKKIEKRH